jgi:exosortase E/protease (VPEID-CTERM system)
MIELMCLSVWLDNESLAGKPGIAHLVHDWGAWAVRCAVGFAAIFATFAYLRYLPELRKIFAEAETVPVNWTAAALHLLSMAGVGVLSFPLYRSHIAGPMGDAALLAWLGAGLAAIATAGCAIAPPASWLRLLRDTRLLWLYSAIAVVAACVAGSASRSVWRPAAQLTYAMVQILLKPFVSGVVSDSVKLTIGTGRFEVAIAPECSGFEGAGLILAFGAAWLLFFRKECRFPQAFLLVPIGVAALFVLNAGRIATLILIGNAGAERVALGGFHSQAGWIAFNAVALGFSLAARRMPWFVRNVADRSAIVAQTENPTAAYLLPFVMILVAGMMSRAATADFEWTYPLRFFAAAATLYYFRKAYREMDWKFDWFAPAVGTGVFLLWVATDRTWSSTVVDSMPTALSQATPSLRAIWIAIRFIAAVVTVPIAEELAFRGFLIRRVISPDFEKLPLRSFTWVGVGLSSVIFGALHGGHIVAGTIAGLLFAGAMLRRGRIGDAVVAHATANLLLGAYVLQFQQWHLW